MCSAPISSVVSESIEVPPFCINKSDAVPIAGFEAIPDVGSEPPHSNASIISLISNSTFSCKERSTIIFLAILVPFSIVFNVPPLFWITTCSTGFNVVSISFFTSSSCIPSQPKATIKTAPTFGFFPNPIKVLNTCL